MDPALRQGPRLHTPDPGEMAAILEKKKYAHTSKNIFNSVFLDHNPFFFVVFHFVFTVFISERKPYSSVAVRQDLIISVAYKASNKTDVKYFYTEQILFF